MKKFVTTVFLICAAIVLVPPQAGFAWQTLEGGCLTTCHSQTQLHPLHAAQVCTVCHPGAAGAKPIPSSNCVVCHPRTGTKGVCPLIFAINTTTGQAIHPQTTCLGCHSSLSNCQAPVTTTTSVRPTTTTSIIPTTTTTSVRPTTTSSVLPNTTTSMQPTTTSIQPATTTTSLLPTTTQDNDTDSDGVPDAEDNCPESNLDETIIIGKCDSGVINQRFEDGCTMSDLIASCSIGAKNHIKNIRCVAHLTNEWKAEGLISGEHKSAIQRCVAKYKKSEGDDEKDDKGNGKGKGGKGDDEDGD